MFGSIDPIDIVETSIAGLGTGALLALTGVAFVIIYKATKVINLAIGEMLMICVDVAASCPRATRGSTRRSGSSASAARACKATERRDMGFGVGTGAT